MNFKNLKLFFCLLVLSLSGTQLFAQDARETAQLIDNMLRQEEANGPHILMNTGTIYYKNGNTETGTVRFQVGVGYNSTGFMQLISETVMQPKTIYPSDVKYVEINNIKFFPLKFATDKGKFTVFAACLVKNLDDKMAMFRIYAQYASQQSTGVSIGLSKDYVIMTANEKDAILLGPLDGRGTLPVPFNKYMSRIVEDCPELAKKVKGKDDGYKVKINLLGNNNDNEDAYFKILEEYNACK
jgi:hypothetical protein